MGYFVRPHALSTFSSRARVNRNPCFAAKKQIFNGYSLTGNRERHLFGDNCSCRRFHTVFFCCYLNCYVSVRFPRNYLRLSTKTNCSLPKRDVLSMISESCILVHFINKSL